MSRKSNISTFFLGMVLYIALFILSWSTFSAVGPNNLRQPFDEISVGTLTRNNTLQSTPRMNEKECPFPRINPFDADIIQYVHDYPTVDCAFNVSKPSLVYLHKDAWLKINKTKVVRLNIKYEACRYTQLKMVQGSDFDIEPYKLWSRRFNDKIHLKEDDEFLYVRCHYRGRIVSRSFVSRFTRKPKIEERVNIDHKKHLKTNSPLDTLNILMIGIDGMSKQAFERSMPQTRNFLLNELRARELHRFNKVGHNTFPNVIPLLTGQHEEELLQRWSYEEYLDKINHLFIWDEYKKAGYRTALMTDVVWLTAFHYMKRGWDKPPFDYFFRPIPVKVYPEKEKGKMREHCIGDIPEVTLLLNYWLQLTTGLNETMNRQPAKPYFAYSFFTRLSHDFASNSNKGDTLYLSFFQEITRRNTLQNTVLLVFSDHGGRFGKIRETYQGMLESRMPFFMFVFPKWFEEKYPKAMATFVANQNRLSTMFDIHATLQDLMNFSGRTTLENNDSKKQKGVSLFHEIPISRNCKDAGIPLKYCLCTRLHNSTISNTMSAILVSTFNQHITSLTLQHKDICERLLLKSIVSVLPVESESSEEVRSFYQVTIETFPGNAIYEGTVSYDSESHEGNVEGDVVRLNMYKGQDECMQELRLKPFCFCKSD